MKNSKISLLAFTALVPLLSSNIRASSEFDTTPSQGPQITIGGVHRGETPPPSPVKSAVQASAARVPIAAGPSGADLDEVRRDMSPVFYGNEEYSTRDGDDNSIFDVSMLDKMVAELEEEIRTQRADLLAAESIIEYRTGIILKLQKTLKGIDFKIGELEACRASSGSTPSDKKLAKSKIERLSEVKTHLQTLQTAFDSAQLEITSKQAELAAYESSLRNTRIVAGALAVCTAVLAWLKFKR